MNINSLQLKTLLLDVITELKFGKPLTDSRKFRREFRKARGLKFNCSISELFNHIVQVYIDNDMVESLNRTLIRFELEPVIVDLFEHYHLLPQEVQDIIMKYPIASYTYEDCRKLEEELKPHGYTFDWYLDATPHSLRKIDKTTDEK